MTLVSGEGRADMALGPAVGEARWASGDGWAQAHHHTETAQEFLKGSGGTPDTFVVRPEDWLA